MLCGVCDSWKQVYVQEFYLCSCGRGVFPGQWLCARHTLRLTDALPPASWSSGKTLSSLLFLIKKKSLFRGAMCSGSSTRAPLMRWTLFVAHWRTATAHICKWNPSRVSPGSWCARHEQVHELLAVRLPKETSHPTVLCPVSCGGRWPPSYTRKCDGIW